MPGYGTMLPLLGIAQGALGGVAQKQEREKSDEEREELMRYRRLQEMIMRQGLADQPGVVMGADAANTPQAGDIMRIAQQAMNVGSNPLAPINDPTFATDMGQNPRSLIDLGKLTIPGQEQELPVAFDPSMGSVAMAQRGRESSMMDEAIKEAEAYNQYLAVKEEDPAIGPYVPGVDYAAEYRSLLSSGRTGDRAAASSTRTRENQIATENRKAARESKLRDLKNDAYSYFQENPEATVEDYHGQLRDSLANAYDAAEVNKIRRELLEVEGDPWAAKSKEIRRGYIKYLGPPGKPLEGDDISVPGNADLHSEILTALSEPYAELGRPLTVAEVIEGFQGQVDSGVQSADVLAAVRAYLRPLEHGNESLEEMLSRILGDE